MPHKNAKWLAALGIALSFIGLLNATYLTVNHLTGTVPPCAVTSGCENVLTSDFAMVGPVPLAMLGGVYYLLVLGALVAFLDTGRQLPLQLASVLATGGLGMSLWLVGVQVFELNAFCIYCLLSAVICLLLLPTLLLTLRAASPAKA